MGGHTDTAPFGCIGKLDGDGAVSRVKYNRNWNSTVLCGAGWVCVCTCPTAPPAPLHAQLPGHQTVQPLPPLAPLPVPEPEPGLASGGSWEWDGEDWEEWAAADEGWPVPEPLPQPPLDGAEPPLTAGQVAPCECSTYDEVRGLS